MRQNKHSIKEKDSPGKNKTLRIDLPPQTETFAYAN